MTMRNHLIERKQLNMPMRFLYVAFTLWLALVLFSSSGLAAEEAEAPEASGINRFSMTILGGSGMRTSRVDADVQRLSRDLFLRDVLLGQMSQDPVQNLIIYREIKNRPDYSLDAASFAFTTYIKNSGLGFGIGIDHYYNQRYGPIPGYMKIVDSSGLPATILRFTGLQPFCSGDMELFCRARESYAASPQTVPYFVVEYRYEPFPFL
ncbi:MAG TPA: hypothetical protein DEA96_18785, partial [Leptospiraceae bacterium]|nr:hypothetical protein [Leptospiraceae bacterium]